MVGLPCLGPGPERLDAPAPEPAPGGQSSGCATASGPQRLEGHGPTKQGTLQLGGEQDGGGPPGGEKPSSPVETHRDGGGEGGGEGRRGRERASHSADLGMNA